MSTHQLKEPDDQVLRKIWNKALTVISLDPNLWRLDSHFKPIKFTEYGNRDSKYGWEIDHIISKNHGGANSDSNLQPLNWRSNVEKADGFLP